MLLLSLKHDSRIRWWSQNREKYQPHYLQQATGHLKVVHTTLWSPHLAPPLAPPPAELAPGEFTSGGSGAEFLCCCSVRLFCLLLLFSLDFG